MKEKIPRCIAVLGLILNILIWPGLGTIVCKKYMRGTIQMVLFIIATWLMMKPIIEYLFLNVMNFGALFFIGMLAVLGVWIWSIIDGALILKKAK